MSKLPNVIGITGYAQNGKDSVAEILEGVGYKVARFSDSLKDMALVVDPWIPCDNLEHRFSGNWRLSSIVERVGWEGAKKNEEVRRFLIALGTQGVRHHVGEDAWIAALMKKTAGYSPLAKLVIPDVRFRNEAAWIHRRHGELWRVTRYGSVPADSPDLYERDQDVPLMPFHVVDPDDESEREIPSLYADVEIKNDDTLEALQEKVKGYVMGRCAP